MSRTLLCAWVFFAGLLSQTASATSIITVGDHNLLPNRAGQKVQVFVSGGDQVQGEDLYIQIADGGAVAGGTATGPIITAVDIVNGTIFNGNHTGNRARPEEEGAFLFWEASTTTNPTMGSVPTQGLLATITIDTTGIFSGAVPLSLQPDNPFGPGKVSSSFAAATEIPVVINDGMLTIVNGWHHSLNPLDTNADTLVNALDVLLVVNELNARGTRALEQIIAPIGPPPYYDVSGDTMISPLDVLQIVNYINVQPGQGSLQSLAAPSARLLSTAEAPEPGTLCLAVVSISGCALAFRRRRS